MSYDTAPLPQFQPPTGKKWYQRKRYVIPSAALAVFLLIGIIGAATGAGKKKDVQAGRRPQAPATVTIEHTVSASPTATATSASVTASPSAHHPTAVSTTPVVKHTIATHPTKAAQPKAESWTMPDERGVVLQDAQDDIQALTNDNIFYTRSSDALGAGRHQFLDRDRKVCSQNISAGSLITADSDIVFDVVKLDESCP